MSEQTLSQLKLGREVHQSDHLDSVPRSLSRKHLPANLVFNGEDMWNAFEASFLLPNRKPVLLHLQVRYPASTPNIVESKSFKLFLNHFNFSVFEDIESFLEMLKQSLSSCVGGPIQIDYFLPEQSPVAKSLPGFALDDLNPEPYPEAPDASLLRKEQSTNQWTFHSHLLRSRCPVTGQPDWGAVIIEGRGDSAPMPASLLTYILSYRSHQGFHEACCEQIFADITQIFQPQELTVQCLYTRRGGLDINPLRTSKSQWSPLPHLAWRQ